MGRERDKNGRFVKGNEIGKETRAKVGDKLASKYREEYGEQMLEWFRDETRPYPQFVFFAQEIGVDSDTLENWCKEYPHFRCCYNECKKIQLGKLVEGTMFRQFDSSFAKFIAINCHGMKEKVEQDTVVKVKMELPSDVDEEAN